MVQDEFIIPERIFFYIHPPVIEKMFDALENFHGSPPFLFVYYKILTSDRKIAHYHEYREHTSTKFWWDILSESIT